MARRNQQSDCLSHDDAGSCIVPAGVPSWITPELIESTIRTWQPYYTEVLTLEEAVTMILGVSRLYQVLSTSKPP
ncbi:hypothetical protein GYB59_25040 [bacterium]|nr:hypothetical protein [bacterium]